VVSVFAGYTVSAGVAGICDTAGLTPPPERMRAAPTIEGGAPDLFSVIDDAFRKLPITRAPGT